MISGNNTAQMLKAAMIAVFKEKKRQYPEEPLDYIEHLVRCELCCVMSLIRHQFSTSYRKQPGWHFGDKEHEKKVMEEAAEAAQNKNVQKEKQ
tara:strand:- start:34 stop:312 length:279 start_codon:yes stop_codon:yes gene_type:complete